MEQSINYVKIKKERIGICNMCGNETKLTWDHVPPKGSIIFNDVEISSIMNHLVNAQREKRPKELSQNGMKFRTICASCNNLVGSKYDIIFNEFIKKLSDLIKLNIGTTTQISIEVNLELLSKCLISHMLTAKADDDKTTIDLKMQEFILGDKKYSDINIHYCFYPYAANQVARDIAISKIDTSKTAMISFLKVYPIVFLLTYDDMFIGEIPRLNDYYQYEYSNSIETIKFDISKFHYFNWPLICDDNTILFTGNSINSSVMAIPRSLIR